MKRILRTTFLAAVLLAVACTPRQEVAIATAEGASAGPDSRTISIAGADYPGLSRSELTKRLTTAGYTVVPASRADLTARFSLEVGEPRTVVYEQRYPEYQRFERFVEINGELRSFDEDVFIGYRTETFRETAYPVKATMTISPAASPDQTLAERRAELGI